MKIFSWRKTPVLLLGKNVWRWQNLEGKAYWIQSDGGDMGLAPSPQQYRSKWGFQVTWPFCFHVWIMPELGQFDEKGNHIPGTERGWYFRFGFVWRVDFYELSWYGPFNRHWD